jgi:cholinesterase
MTNAFAPSGGSSSSSGLASLVSSVGGIVGSVMGNIMTCGSRDAARARVAVGVKAWRYRYYGVWPNQAISATAGAYHASEVPIVFGTTEFVTGKPDTEEEAALIKGMGKAWSEFAKDPVGGLERVGWPVFDESSELQFIS